MIANLKHGEKELYDRRFQTFLSKIANADKNKRYLYPMMEPAADMAITDRTRRKANDNTL